MGTPEYDNIKPAGLVQYSVPEAAVLRVVFMGTPGFACAILTALHDWSGAQVLAVYTQPDRPCGRGQFCTPCEVKKVAQEHGIPVRQPKNFTDPAVVHDLQALAPDILIVAAYGLLLPVEVLESARLGAVNVHASLLPEYRGAAPIQRAILDGKTTTGISIMQMDTGLDTGDILMSRSLPVEKNHTAQDVHDGLAILGGALLVEALEAIQQGRHKAVPQDNAQATYAAKLKKSEGEIDWNQPAQDIHNRIRAMHPWPGAYFFWQQTPQSKPLRLVLMPGEIGEKITGTVLPAPGSITGLQGDKLAISCADRYYLVPAVKPAGKKCMQAQAFVCGYLGLC